MKTALMNSVNMNQTNELKEGFTYEFVSKKLLEL